MWYDYVWNLLGTNGCAITILSSSFEFPITLCIYFSLVLSILTTIHVCLRSGLHGGNRRVPIACCLSSCPLRLSSMYTGGVLRCWLLKWGTTKRLRVSSRCFCVFSIYWFITRSSLHQYETYPHIITDPPLPGWVGWMCFGPNQPWRCHQTWTLPSVTCNNILHSFNQRILHRDTKFQPTWALYHIRQSWICLSGNKGCLSGWRSRYPAILSQFLS